MRELHDHESNPINEKISVAAIDEPGSGGAHHLYQISDGGMVNVLLPFQIGGLKEVGVNGITNEALLAVVIDRLACFQKGPYECVENASALRSLMEGMNHLHSRTRQRTERGVEGTAAL